MEEVEAMDEDSCSSWPQNTHLSAPLPKISTVTEWGCRTVSHDWPPATLPLGHSAGLALTHHAQNHTSQPPFWQYPEIQNSITIVTLRMDSVETHTACGVIVHSWYPLFCVSNFDRNILCCVHGHWMTNMGQSCSPVNIHTELTDTGPDNVQTVSGAPRFWSRSLFAENRNLSQILTPDCAAAQQLWNVAR